MATLIFISNVLPLIAIIIAVAFGLPNEFIYWSLVTLMSGNTMCLFLTGLSDCSDKVRSILDKLDDWVLEKF